MKSKVSSEIEVSVEDSCIVLDNGCISVRLARNFNAGDLVPGPILGVSSKKGSWLCSGSFKGNVSGGKGQLTSHTKVQSNGKIVLLKDVAASVSEATTADTAVATRSLNPIQINASHGILAVVYEAVIQVVGNCEYRMKVELLAGEDFLKISESMESRETAMMRLCFDGIQANQMAVSGYPGYPAELIDPNTYKAPCGVITESIVALGSQQICGQIGTPWFALSDGKSAVGAVVCAGGDWIYPGDNTLRVMRTDKGLELTGEARRGSRQWLLVTGTAKNWMPRKGESATALSKLKTRISDLPAEKVSKWILDIAETMTHPTIWVDKTGLDAARKNLDAPEWDNLIESIDRIEIQDRLYTEDESRCFGMDGTTDSFRNGILWLKLKEDSCGRALAEDIQKWLTETVNRFETNGLLGHKVDIVTLRTLKHCLYWYDLLRGSGLMSQKAACEIRRSLLFCAYCTYDRDYFDWESAYAPAWSKHSIRRFLLEEDYSDTMGCENFHSDLFSYIGAVGLAFPDHPMSSEWINHAEQMSLMNLEYYIAPDGTYVESDNYYQHLLGVLYYLGYALSRAGRRSVLEHPRMQTGLKYWVRAQTPLLRHTGAPQTNWFGVYTADPKHRPISQMLPLGDTGLNWGGQSLPAFLHHAANYFAESNPQLASWLEWAWQRSGRPLINSNFTIQDLLTQSLSGPKPCEYPLASDEFEGHGVIMRADVNSERETAILVSTGRATSHMHFDGGGLTIWHAGVPLVVDSGYIHDEFTAKRKHGSASWKHSTVTFNNNDPGNGYLGMEHMQAPSAVRLDKEFDYVACDLSQNNTRDGSWMNIRRIVSIEHYRQLLFAKNRYLVVKDRIYRSIYPATWNLWVMAVNEEITGNQVRFKGRFGVDLLVRFIQPANPSIKVESFSGMRHLTVQQDPERDFLVFIQPLLPNEKAFATKAIQDGLEISGQGWSERILMDALPGMGAAGEWFSPRHDSGNGLVPLRPGHIGAGEDQVAAKCAIRRNGKTVVLHEN